MPRQRFIWPGIWKDPLFGRLTDAEQVLFIGLFSIADDEGRGLADPAYLRSELFPYKEIPIRKILALRNSVAEKCPNVLLYQSGGTDYVALRKWSDYQKPKYPKPSRIPPPTLPEDSPNDPGGLPENGAVGWVGLGRVGLGRAVDAGEAVEESGEGKAAAAPRERDEIWDELVALFGEVPPKTNAHGKRNKAVRDLKAFGATAAGIRTASRQWSTLYPQASLTDLALATHYGALSANGRKTTECPHCGTLPASVRLADHLADVHGERS